MNHLFKRSLSLIVAVIMVLAMIPANPVHVHAAVDEENYIGYAVDVSTAKPVSRGVKIGTPVGVSKIDSSNKVYPIDAGGYVPIRIDAATPEGAAFLEDFDGKATVEIAFVSSYGKPTFKYYTGDAELKTATAVGSKTVASGITAYVYELDDAAFAGTENVSFQISFAAKGYFRSVKVLKGVNEPEFVTDATRYNQNYRNGEKPAAIKVRNPGATKTLWAYADVNYQGKPQQTNYPLVTGYSANKDFQGDVVKSALLNQLLTKAGAYEITIRVYWNVQDDDHKVEQTYSFTWCPCTNKSEATCTAPQTCPVCDTTYGVKLDHDYSGDDGKCVNGCSKTI